MEVQLFDVRCCLRLFMAALLLTVSRVWQTIISAASGVKDRGGEQDDMVTFTPASDVWTLGFDQFDNICWQHNETKELYYIPPGQLLALPPRNVVNAPCAIPQGDLSSIPATTARPEVVSLPEFNEEGQFHDTSILEVPEAVRVWSASIVEDTTPRPSASISRVKEVNLWSREHDIRGKEYYYNIITGKTQYKKPDCLKKYPRRR